MQFVYTFLINESKTLNKDIIISQRALDILASYSYKGNVGELKILLNIYVHTLILKILHQIR